jgi:hypothetical protein
MVHAAGETVLGKYRVVRPLGAGGFGQTYLAEAPDGTRVVVKEPSFERGEEWKPFQLFEREAQILARLDHPGIPRLIESFLGSRAGQHGQRMGLVQQYVEGSPLPVAMLCWTPSEGEARALARRLLDIVVYLQSLHPPVLHRDIKPANVLRASDGTVHLIDFGSVGSERGEGITVAGTPGFMAPEQLVGQAGLSTDVYGVAATVLYLLTRRSPGELPRKGRRIDVAAVIHVTRGFCGWRIDVAAVTHVTRGFCGWLSRALEPESEDRFKNAAQAREALLRCDRGVLAGGAGKLGLLAGGGVLALGAVATAGIVTGARCVKAGSVWSVSNEQAAAGDVEIDSSRRTVTTPRFFAQWSVSNPADPEVLDDLRWRGQANITRTLGGRVCQNGDVEYFGNAWSGAGPHLGDKIFVGAGSTGTWKTLDSASVKIDSSSAGCPTSTNIPVKTTYTFARSGPAADVIRVRRVYDFGPSGFRGVVRPYIPRFNFGDFSRVIYPDTAGTTLVSEDVTPCGWVCQRSNWNGTWFAVIASSGPLAGQGVIVTRRRSEIAAGLWLDWDSGSSTNATSAVLLQPKGGFTGVLQEDEALCFFDASSWPAARQSSLVLPDGCDADD